MIDPANKDILNGYQDRKKLKWAGFYLSDHTSKLHKQTVERHFVWPPKERQELAEIDRLLYQAKIKNSTVAIQLEEVNTDGLYPPDVIGKVMGYDDLGIYIGEEKVGYDEIRHVELVAFQKWSDVQ